MQSEFSEWWLKLVQVRVRAMVVSMKSMKASGAGKPGCMGPPTVCKRSRAGDSIAAGHIRTTCAAPCQNSRAAQAVMPSAPGPADHEMEDNAPGCVGLTATHDSAVQLQDAHATPAGNVSCSQDAAPSPVHEHTAPARAMRVSSSNAASKGVGQTRQGSATTSTVVQPGSPVNMLVPGTVAAKAEQGQYALLTPQMYDVPPQLFGLKPGLVVCHSVKVADTAAGQLLSEWLQQAMPEGYPSQTAAKRGCRRKELYVNGEAGSTTTRVAAGDWVQQVLRQNGVPDAAAPSSTLQQANAAVPSPTLQQANAAASSAPSIDTHVRQAQGTAQQLQQASVQQPVAIVATAAAADVVSVDGKPGLQVVYEDDHLAVVFKPSGIPTQGSGTGSLQGRVKYCLTPSRVPGALWQPQQCHRLDAATSGLVLVAKTRLAMTRISVAFKERAVKKRYIAIVKGKVHPAKGTVDKALSGQPAITHYEVLQVIHSATFGTLSTLSLWPHTGRKHQLRRHCAEVLHAPMLGDPKYRDAEDAATKWKRIESATATRASEGHIAMLLDGGTLDSRKTDAALMTGVPAHADLQQGPRFSSSLVNNSSKTFETGNMDTQSNVCIGCEPGENVGEQSNVEDLVDADGGNHSRQDVLSNGEVANLCLCAAEVEFAHPATGLLMQMRVHEPDMFRQYRDIEEQGVIRST